MRQLYYAMLSPARPSVSLSHGTGDKSKTVEISITQFSHCSSPIPLVLAG